MTKKFIPCILMLLFLLCGCTVTTPGKNEQKFVRIFNWGLLKNEECARRYHLAGVTDIRVRNKKELALAKKYGMIPYYGCFTPAGPHRQVLSPEEEKFHNYINGFDLPPSVSRTERRKIIHRRRIEKNHRFGGESSTPYDTVNVKSIYCFISDKDLRLSKAKIDKILDKALPGVRGIYFDYLGYTNHRGCYCKNCLALYREYLKKQRLSDSEENRGKFYREQLVKYYCDMVKYVKSRRPDFKVVAHFYTDFKYDPFYGNRTSVDFGGHTVAWYFKAPLPEIIRNTKKIIAEEKLFHPHIMSIPFLGLNTDPDSALGYKTPAETDAELRAILSAGGRTLMVCNGSAMIEPGYFEVFRKYSGR